MAARIDTATTVKKRLAKAVRLASRKAVSSKVGRRRSLRISKTSPGATKNRKPTSARTVWGITRWRLGPSLSQYPAALWTPSRLQGLCPSILEERPRRDLCPCEGCDHWMSRYGFLAPPLFRRPALVPGQVLVLDQEATWAPSVWRLNGARLAQRLIGRGALAWRSREIALRSATGRSEALRHETATARSTCRNALRSAMGRYGTLRSVRGSNPGIPTTATPAGTDRGGLALSTWRCST